MTALSTYSFVSALHVIFVITMLGVTFSFMFISGAAKKDPPHMLFALGVTRKIQETLVLPGIPLILGTGFYLAIDGKWHDQADSAWIVVSEAWYTLAILLSVFVAYPAVRTMQAEAKKMAENPGSPSDAFMAKAGIMKRLGPFLSFSVVGIAFLMVAKPF
jgi:uncharacterized membrane protein